MMPSIANAWRTRSVFSNVGSGKVWTTGQDYRFTGTSAGVAGELATLVNNAWVAWFQTIVTGTTPIQSYMRSEVKLVEVQVYDLGADGAVSSQAGNAAAKGLVTTTTAVPPDLAIVISKRTATRGAKGRGRCYISGWATNALDSSGSGYIASVLHPVVASAYSAAFKDVAVGGASYKAVVISQQPSIGLDKHYDITSFSADNHWDVQRRRGQR